MYSKKKVLLATHNSHKAREVQEMLGEENYHVYSLHDISYEEEIIEDGNTMEENALIKARVFVNKGWPIIIGEDSGLEILALDNRPGVNTARFAGPDKDPIGNMRKVLELMVDKPNRAARFRTAIALIVDGKYYTIEGMVNGKIAHEMRGDEGFGYDPIFIPDGYDQTFAELGNEIKNRLSHRFKAVLELQKLLEKIVPASKKDQ